MPSLKELLNIEFTVGRSGIITPIANFEPIKLAGTIVKRATLHNESVINRLGLRENDKVLVKKSGEIIPKIIGVDIVGRDFESKKIEFIICELAHLKGFVRNKKRLQKM